MSKFKTSEYSMVNWSKDKTVMETFEEYFSKHKKVSELLDFLMMLNARCLTYRELEKVPEKLQVEIIEFCDYFQEKVGEGIMNRIIDMYGDIPIIFEKAEIFSELILYKKQKKEWDAFDGEIKTEAELLAERIWKVRKDRELSFFMGNYTDITETLYLQDTIRKEEHDMCQTFLKYDCAVMLLTCGALTGRFYDKNGTCQIFGIRTDGKGHWIPVSAREMSDAYTRMPDGSYLEPEDGESFTELTR